jgi:hypothetical protein
VRQATDEAKADKGQEAEARLRAMLGNPAYTAAQRAVIHLALGGAYRRWEGHDRDAAASFLAAWRAAEESVCGRAGMRLYLTRYGDPSLALGWQHRHTSGDGNSWNLEDAPRTLEPGSYRLQLRLTGGSALSVTDCKLLAAGAVKITHGEAIWLSKADPVHDLVFSVTEPLAEVSVRLQIGRGGRSRGTLQWSRMP